MAEVRLEKNWRATKTVALFKRLCSHLGIPFSANKVFPGLADLNRNGQTVREVDQLNAIG